MPAHEDTLTGYGRGDHGPESRIKTMAEMITEALAVRQLNVLAIDDEARILKGLVVRRIVYG